MIDPFEEGRRGGAHRARNVEETADSAFAECQSLHRELGSKIGSGFALGAFSKEMTNFKIAYGQDSILVGCLGGGAYGLFGQELYSIFGETSLQGDRQTILRRIGEWVGYKQASKR